MLCYRAPHRGDHATGPDTVVHAGRAQVVGVVPPLHEELVPREAGAVVDHEHAALHPDGAAAVEHGVQVGAVAHALIVRASEVPVLVEDDLVEQRKENLSHSTIPTDTNTLVGHLNTNLPHVGCCCGSILWCCPLNAASMFIYLPLCASCVCVVIVMRPGVSTDPTGVVLLLFVTSSVRAQLPATATAQTGTGTISQSALSPSCFQRDNSLHSRP